MRTVQVIIAEQLAVIVEAVKAGGYYAEEEMGVEGVTPEMERFRADFREAAEHLEKAKHLIRKHCRPEAA